MAEPRFDQTTHPSRAMGWPSSSEIPLVAPSRTRTRSSRISRAWSTSTPTFVDRWTSTSASVQRAAPSANTTPLENPATWKSDTRRLFTPENRKAAPGQAASGTSVVPPYAALVLPRMATAFVSSPLWRTVSRTSPANEYSPVSTRISSPGASG